MTNPAGFCYSSTKGVNENAAPGWLFIPDQHRDDPVYAQAQAQAKGAEVAPYLNMAEDKIRGDKDREFRAYVGDTAKPWGNNRASWYPLLDIRVGREYVRRTVDYIAEKFMPRFDGVTLDVVGGQLHAKADWANWPATERKQWQDGMVDFVRQLDERRRQVKPWFKIVTINIWDQDKRGLDYVDGFCLESPNPGVGLYYRNLVALPCSYLGQRRVIVIADNVAEAEAYAKLPGVTHVTVVDRSLGHSYKTLTPPVVKPQDTRLAEAQAMREWLHANGSNAQDVTRLEQLLAGAHAETTRLSGELTESRETSRLLGDRVELLTTKIQTMAAFVAEQAEGIE